MHIASFNLITLLIVLAHYPNSPVVVALQRRYNRRPSLEQPATEQCYQLIELALGFQVLGEEITRIALTIDLVQSGLATT